MLKKCKACFKTSREFLFLAAHTSNHNGTHRKWPGDAGEWVIAS